MGQPRQRAPRTRRATSPARATPPGPGLRSTWPPASPSVQRAGWPEASDGQLEQLVALAQAPRRAARGARRRGAGSASSARGRGQACPPSRTRARRGPDSSTAQPPGVQILLDRLLEAVGVEGPGVGAVAAQVQADAVRARRSRPPTIRRRPGVERHAHVPVREVGGETTRSLSGSLAGEGVVVADEHLGCLRGSRRSGKTTRTMRDAASGCTAWNGMGVPVDVDSQRSPQSSKSRNGSASTQPVQGSGSGLRSTICCSSRGGSARRATAPRGLDGDLLARDPRAPLHRPHGLPGRRDRGAGEDVVERREEQVVPAAVEPLAERAAAPRASSTKPSTRRSALVEQVLAAALRCFMSCITL